MVCLVPKDDYPKDKRKIGQRDYFGLSLMGGDRYGEIIPSMFAWRPPDEQRRRAAEMMEMSTNLNLEYETLKAKEGKGLGKKKKKKPVIDSAKERSIAEAEIYETMRPQVDNDTETRE